MKLNKNKTRIILLTHEDVYAGFGFNRCLACNERFIPRRDVPYHRQTPLMHWKCWRRSSDELKSYACQVHDILHRDIQNDYYVYWEVTTSTVKGKLKYQLGHNSCIHHYKQ